jgi:hypothetical protein
MPIGRDLTRRYSVRMVESTASSTTSAPPARRIGISRLHVDRLLVIQEAHDQRGPTRTAGTVLPFETISTAVGLTSESRKRATISDSSRWVRPKKARLRSAEGSARS